ncbi:hypothetical protein SAP269_14500 [Spiroplasma ixodetis]|uniref:Uncharacterized protein n=1 Tax=Spiroplasma ixodetis TaxID=2141 RepID=A0ABM8JSJ6_9MOLU
MIKFIYGICFLYNGLLLNRSNFKSATPADTAIITKSALAISVAVKEPLIPILPWLSTLIL